MQNKILSLAAVVLLATLGSASAQGGRGGMAAPSGPNFGGANSVLFGDFGSFSANLEMQAAGQAITGKMFYSDGKSRLEMDMTKMAAANPATAAQLKQMGMDSVISISRPDKKVSYLIYPGLNAYVEIALPDSAASVTNAKPKTDITKLGTETLSGHACTKNKVVVTDEQGVAHESTVWNADDLKKFPVKIEQTEGGQTSTMVFKDVKFDKVDAANFEPPSGAKKYTDIMTMMQQEMMSRAMRGRGQ